MRLFRTRSSYVEKSTSSRFSAATISSAAYIPACIA